MASYYTSSAVPIPSKEHEYHSGESTYSVSPPSDHDASMTSGYGGEHGSVNDYSGTGTDSSADYYYYHQQQQMMMQQGGADYYDYSGSAASASGVDFNDYIQDRFAESFDPIPLDRSLAVQAQTSGKLNAKHRELMELQAKAQARLAKTRERFQEGLQDAQEVRANLEWTSKKVSSMKKKAEKKHSKEYKKARERYPSPEY
jgi:hypothetical protein